MTRIVVVDNHGQFTHLEQRALRDIGVDAAIVDNGTPPEEVEADGVVLSGGPDMDRVGRAPDYLEADVPVFGICLGMQLIAAELGGEVGSGDYGGYADVTVEIEDDDDPLVGSLAPAPGGGPHRTRRGGVRELRRRLRGPLNGRPPPVRLRVDDLFRRG